METEQDKGRYWNIWKHCSIFRRVRKGTQEGLVLRAAVSTFEFKGLQDPEQFEIVWKEAGGTYDLFAKQTVSGKELAQIITREFVMGPPQWLTPPLVEFMLLPLQKANWVVTKEEYCKMVRRVKSESNKLVPLIWARGRGSKQHKAAAAKATAASGAKETASDQTKRAPAQKRKRDEQKQVQKPQGPSSKAKAAQQQHQEREDVELKPAAKKQRKQQGQPEKQTKKQHAAPNQDKSSTAAKPGKPKAGPAKGKTVHDTQKKQQQQQLASKPQQQQLQHVGSSVSANDTERDQQLNRGVAAAAAGSHSPCKG